MTLRPETYSTAWRCILAAAVLAVAFGREPRAERPAAAFTLDGVRDPGYTLLARDPAGDLAPTFALSSTTSWADLTNLYVATDTTNLWVYVDLPNYNALSSVGEFGLAIDTDGKAGSGGSQDPWLNAITYAYTSTWNNVDATPVLTTQALLPDVVVRGRLFGNGNTIPSGYTDLDRWSGGGWTRPLENWGGVSGSSPIGTHIAFSNGAGIELSIPFSDLGVPATRTLNLEFYTTGQFALSHQQGAWDTVPSDAQSQTDDNEATTERRLATFNPLPPAVVPKVSFGSSDYAVGEAAGTAPITITVAPTSTRTITVTVATSDGTAGPEDYVPLSQLVTFAPGQSASIVQVQVLTDTMPEADETVLLALSDPSNAELGQPFTATLTIHDSPPLERRKFFLPFVRR